MGFGQGDLPIRVDWADCASEGPRTLDLQLDFRTATSQFFDFQSLVDRKQQTQSISLYIDNSGNAQDFWIRIKSTNQSIKIPAGAQAYMPILSGHPLVVSFESTGGVIVPVQVLNFKMVPHIWNQNFDINVADPLPVLIEDQPIAVTGTFTPSGTQDVSIVSSVTLPVGVVNFPAVQPISGTVAISNFPAIQPVSQSGSWTVAATQSGSWTVAATQSGTWNVNATVTFAAPQHVIVDSGSIAVSNFPATQNVDITASITLPVSGPLTDAQLRATPVPISGTVTVSFSAPQHVIVDSSALPTGAATETTLAALNAKFNSLGQKTMAASAPVVIASDQSALPVSGTITAVTSITNTVTTKGDAGDNADAVAPIAAPGVLRAGAEIYGYNGTNFDRLRSNADNADALAVSALGILRTLGENFGFNGTSWDRLRSGADNADSVTAVALGILRAASENFGFNGTSWDRLRSGADNADAVAAIANGVLRVLAETAGFNGTSFDRIRTNAAAYISGTTQPFSLSAAPPGQFAQIDNPAANTQASTTKAAGAAGVRHVFNGGVANMFNQGGGASLNGLVLRDGATGAGTIKFNAVLAITATANSIDKFQVTGLEIVGSAATAMCFEFTAGPGANNSQNVTLIGYSTV